MAIKSDQQLKFIKKQYDTVELARTASEAAGVIVFDAAHNVICVDGKVYGDGSYHGEMIGNKAAILTVLTDPTNRPGYMYTLGDQLVIDGTENPASGVPTGTYEAGDLFIKMGNGWNVITGENQVSNDQSFHSFNDATAGLSNNDLDGTATVQVAQSGQDVAFAAKKKLSAKVGDVDGMELDVRLENPAVTSGDLIAYNEFSIGQLTIPAGSKIPAGTSIEAILRSMITKIVWPGTSTQCALSVAAGQSFSWQIVGTAVTITVQPKATISTGSFGNGGGAISGQNTPKVKKYITFGAGTVNSGFTANGAFSQAKAEQSSGSATQAVFNAYSDNLSNATRTVALGDNKITVPVTGKTDAWDQSIKPKRNDGTEVTKTEASAAENSVFLAAKTDYSKSFTHTATGILPVFTNFAKGSTNGTVGGTPAYNGIPLENADRGFICAAQVTAGQNTPLSTMHNVKDYLNSNYLTFIVGSKMYNGAVDPCVWIPWDSTLTVLQFNPNSGAWENKGISGSSAVFGGSAENLTVNGVQYKYRRVSIHADGEVGIRIKLTTSMASSSGRTV